MSEKQINNLKNLSDIDKKQIFDIILTSSKFETKEYIFNELVENLGLCDIKNYSKIMQINKRQVYRLLDVLKHFKIDSYKIMIINS